MAATDYLRDAVRRSLPSSLPNSREASEEELDARFLEATEALVLSLANDPDAPYYLTQLVVSRAQELLRALASATSSILSAIDTSPRKLPPPEKDRNYALAEDALARISDSIAAGKTPDAADLSEFDASASAFAITHLVPQEDFLSREAYRLQLDSAVTDIDAALPKVLTVLENLDPQSFFVDDLVTLIPRARQLAVYVERMRGVLDQHSAWLGSDDVNVRVSNAPRMLAETATLITTLSSLSNVSALAHRFRAAGLGTFVAGAVDTAATLTGVSLPSTVDGEDPYLGIAAADTLVLDVDLDPEGVAVQRITVNLPDPTGPSVVFSAANWTFRPGVDAVSVACRVSKAGELVTFSGAVVPVRVFQTFADAAASSPQTGDFAHILDSAPPSAWAVSTGYTAGTSVVTNGGVTYTCIANHTSAASDEPGVGASWTTYWIIGGPAPVPETFQYNGATWDDYTVATEINTDHPSVSGVGYSVTLPPEDLDGVILDVRNQLTGSDATTEDLADVITAVGVNGAPGSLTFTLTSATWRTLGEDTYLYAEVVSSSDDDSGTSPTLSDVAAAIEAQAGGAVTATTLGGRRLVITSATVGTVGDQSSCLQVITQPLQGVEPILGLPATAVYGTSRILRDDSADFLSARLVPGMVVTDGNYVEIARVVEVLDETSLRLDRDLSSSTAGSSYLVFATGALSYYKGPESESGAYSAARAQLLSGTEELSQVLAQSLFSESARIAARNYVVSVLGDPEQDSGPVYDLLGILSAYSSAESDSLAAAIRVLRERGYDKAVDRLLLGEISSALAPEDASYGKALRNLMVRTGLSNLA